MKKWFTSDWHLGEDRIGINGKPNLFYRPFGTVAEQNGYIYNKFCNSGFQDGDELWHLGDVVYQWDDNLICAKWVLDSLKSRFRNSKFNLIVGNYDEDKLELLGKYFNNIYAEVEIYVGDTRCFLNHYPVQVKNYLDKSSIIKFGITGHIHGLWKVQRKMVNVGVDAWHFTPVPEETISFAMNACEKYYDENVFPY